MSRTPFFGVWAHSWAQNGPGRENPIWTCFVTATWPFWTKNGVKSAFLVGLRQNKAQKWWKHVKTCLERPFSVALTHFGTHHSTQAPSRGAWARMHTRQHFVILTSFELQNRPRPQRKTFLDIFWRVFIISGLYFAWNRPEMHFLRHFWVKISQMPQKWSFFALNLHKKCNSGRFWAK